MMKLQISPKLKQYLSWKQLMFSWYRHYKVLFFFGFLVVASFGGYFWYENLYQYHWSDERKKTFLEQHFKETRFKEKAFENIVTHLGERARSHEEELPLSRDIFSGKSLE